MWKYKIVELYCGIYWEYHRHWNSHHFRLRPGVDFSDGMEEVDNPEYDPAFPRPHPPAFCKRMVGVDCLKNNCTYVAYCDGAPDPDPVLPESAGDLYGSLS